MDVLLDVRNLKTHFYTRRGVVKAVDGVSFQVRRGETVALVGESGSGKSVTVRSIMGLIASPGRIVDGQVVFQGQDLLQLGESKMQHVRGSRISMIFQEPSAHLNPVLSVGYQIAEVLLTHQGVKRTVAMQRSRDLLELMGIPDVEQRCRHYSHQLSGGMCQRVMIAMAMACSPQLLIADEPTTALDVTIEAQVLQLIKDLAAKFATSVVLVTHNMGIVADWADRINVMYLGKVVESAPRDDLYYDARHPYARGLLDSIPRLDRPRGARLTAIDGLPPDPEHAPPGCGFHPRCALATARCAQEEPPLAQVSDTGHWCACWRQAEAA